MKIRRDLSSRESQIHDLMEQGVTDKMIAATLGLHLRTATIYIANLKMIEAAQSVHTVDTRLRLSGSATRST